MPDSIRKQIDRRIELYAGIVIGFFVGVILTIILNCIS